MGLSSFPMSLSVCCHREWRPVFFYYLLQWHSSSSALLLDLCVCVSVSLCFHHTQPLFVMAKKRRNGDIPRTRLIHGEWMGRVNGKRPQQSQTDDGKIQWILCSVPFWPTSLPISRQRLALDKCTSPPEACRLSLAHTCLDRGLNFGDAAAIFKLYENLKRD